MSFSSSSPKGSFWKRRIVAPVVAQLTQGVSPEKIALTLAVGSALALFPILGSTTVLCLVAGIAMRLNQPIIQTLNQALWPVQLPSIYFCIRAGERVFAAPKMPLNIGEMNQLFWAQPSQFFHVFGATALHAVVVWAVLAPIYMSLIYFALLPVVRGAARRRTTAATKPAAHS